VRTVWYRPGMTDKRWIEFMKESIAARGRRIGGLTDKMLEMQTPRKTPS
jgi:hypothetical protein